MVHVLLTCVSVVLLAIVSDSRGGVPGFSPEQFEACPGDEVAFNCTVVDTSMGTTQSTLWSANTSQCSLAHPLMKHDVPCGDFEAEIVHIEENCFSSIFQLTVTEALDNLVVVCASPTTADVIGSGSIHLIGDVPAPVNGLTYNVTSYGQETVTIQVQWTYPSTGPRVDEYTVTSDSLDSPIVLTDEQITLTSLYYNTAYAITVTASNCNGFGNASILNYLEGGCDPPESPENGTIIEFVSAQEGARVTYRCNEAPNSLLSSEPLPMFAVCTAQGWLPNPAEFNCTTVESEGSTGANIYIVTGGIVGGVIIVLVLHGLFIAICSIRAPHEKPQEDTSMPIKL